MSYKGKTKEHLADMISLNGSHLVTQHNSDKNMTL
jgi:hypothetical protein